MKTIAIRQLITDVFALEKCKAICHKSNSARNFTRFIGEIVKGKRLFDKHYFKIRHYNGTGAGVQNIQTAPGRQIRRG